ncbi:MAG: lamin tail domain-containing protein [Kiritimatiellae bacterium]|nr:lamin tail domain-containing protein [Kiritimatiellia bacterium]
MAAGLTLALLPAFVSAETLVAAGSSWCYAKGTAEVSDPRGAWRDRDFDDSGWARGNAPFGYGETGIQTTLGDMQGTYSSIFIRRTFFVATLDAETRLRARVDYDDGFILWINGERVLDRGEPDGEPLHDSFAALGHESGFFEPYELPGPDDYLEPGENAIAVQLFNAELSSSDCKIDVELTGYQRVADTTFSHDRGFYDGPFTCTIGTATPGATICYTLNGSDPRSNGVTRISGPAPLAVPIDPAGTAGGRSINGEGVPGAVVLRACAVKAGYEPTDTDTQTYIFLEAVIDQPNVMDSEDWIPGESKTVEAGTAANRAKRDTRFEASITGDAGYRAQLKTALSVLPTLSLVADYGDMFGNTAGVFHYALHYGDAWERPASLELVYPDGSKGFQIDCGIRASGGYTREHKAKISVGVRFRSEYGAAKLDYRLFPDSPIDRYDRIKLRAHGNDSSWSLNVQQVRDRWGRETQRAMGWPSAHGMLAHLYINGIYFGVYNPSEVPSASLAAEYLGGEAEDYDCISNLRWSHCIPTPTGDYRVTDGTSTAWDAVKAIDNPADSARYALVRDYLDVTQYADYTLLEMWGNNGDWSPPYRTGDGANFRFTRKSRSRRAGDPPFMGWIWDVECFMEMYPNSAVTDDLTGAYGIGSLHQKLVANSDYRAEFADRIYRHLKAPGGALTPAEGAARYSAIAAEVEQTILCEAARWADASTNRAAYLLVGDWANFRDHLLADWFPRRGDIVIQHWRNRGHYPSLEPPVFSQHGGAIGSGFKLTLSSLHNAASGTIYYTLDGADPRAPGGALRAEALRYEGPVALSRTTHVRARLYKSHNTWSAVHAATCNWTAHYENIRITELMYNPLGGADFEFIEIRNTGSSVRGLSEMTLKGVRYTFPPGAELGGGETAVLAANEEAFTNRYPGLAEQTAHFGRYLGRLDNGGERVALLDADGRTVTSVTYNDASPWPAAADGAGFSLVFGGGDPKDPACWRASNLIGGSPGYDDGAPYRIVISEALTHTDPPQVDAIELCNEGAVAADIGGWYLSDSAEAYRKFRIPLGTSIDAGGYRVFYEDLDFGTNALGPVDGFALSSHGDEVYLTRWDANDNLQYRAEARFGGAANGVAFARHVKSDGRADFVAQSTPATLGGANAPPLTGPVVINEIMYHPTDPSDATREFIELVNVSGGPVALYDPAAPGNGWRIDAAVEYVFPAGTTLAAGEYVLVVPTNEAAFRAACPAVPAGVRVFGPYAGRLGNGGESVKVWRPDAPDAEGTPWILVDRVNYNDNSPWPESADGDGPSLERQDQNAYGNDPANWTASVNAGGTPGRPNSGSLVSKAAGWKYHDRGQDLGTAWRAAGYDDGAWDDGNAPLGYAYPEIDTETDWGADPDSKPLTTYFRRRFTLGTDPGSLAGLTLNVRYDDGFVAYLNGEEVARRSIAASPVLYSTTADNHAATGYETIDLGAHAGKLVRGWNVLAVELHQATAASSDLFVDAELVGAAATAAPFVAYNDLCWASGQLSANITTFGRGQSGNLIDYASGQESGVRLAVGTGGSGPYAAQGADAAAGTDAASVFAGKVDCAGLISYGEDLTLQVSGLAPGLRYEIVLFGNRAEASYTDRLTRVTLSDAVTFENASTPGAQFTGAGDPATVLGNGANTASGLVARYRNVEPGDDGRVLITVSNGGSKLYLNALMLKASEAGGQEWKDKTTGGAGWRYRKGTAEASSRAGVWLMTGYDDGAWSDGVAPFGYGDGPYGTTLTDMQNSYRCLYVRRTILFEKPALVSALRFDLLYDDGFVLWVNGQELGRTNVPGVPGTLVTHDTTALTGQEPCGWRLTLSGAALPELLHTNVLAVQVLNATLDSSDLTLDLSLAALEGSPLSPAEDSDRDGIPDEWERDRLGGTGTGTETDSDGDGLSNMEEYIAGTDPGDGTKVFDVDLSLSGGGIVVAFDTSEAVGPGYSGVSRHYALEQRLGSAGLWTGVTGYTDILGAGQRVSYTDASPAAATYYRARVWIDD